MAKVKVKYSAGAFSTSGPADLSQPDHKYRPLPGTNVAGAMGFHTGPVTRMDIATIVTEKGGTGGVLREMGFQVGTKEYRSAQRAVQRHLKGTQAQGGWQQRYQNLLAPPPGTVTVAVNGEIQVSDDIRSRTVRITISGDRPDMQAAMQDPIGAWFDNAGFAPMINNLTSVMVTYQPQ